MSCSKICDTVAGGYSGHLRIALRRTWMIDKASMNASSAESAMMAATCSRLLSLWSTKAQLQHLDAHGLHGGPARSGVMPASCSRLLTPTAQHACMGS